MSFSDSETAIKTFCIYCFKEFPNFKIMYEHIKTSHSFLQTDAKDNADSRNRPESSKTPSGSHDDKDLELQNMEFFQRIGQDKFLSRKRKGPANLNACKNKIKADASNDNLEEPFICACCYTQLPNFQSFLSHMESHISYTKNEPIGTCVMCDEEFNDTVNFSNHIMNHTLLHLESYICCCNCNKSFKKSEALKTHLTDVHVLSLYKCSICEEIFDSKQLIEKHLSNKHTNESEHYKCNICSYRIFHGKASILAHIMKFHNDQLSAIQFKTPVKYFDNDTNPNEFLQCCFCEKMFIDRYTMYSHILDCHIHLGTSNKEIIKTECENQFERPQIPDEEIASTSKAGKVNLQCAYCKELCKSNSDIQNHLKCHQNTEKLKHKCNICDEIFISVYTLANHKLTHCKIIDGNTCVHCKSVLSDKETFYKHQANHSGSSTNIKSGFIPPTICVICSQTLQSDAELELHALFHMKFASSQNKTICSRCKNITDKQQDATTNILCGACSALANIPQPIRYISDDANYEQSFEVYCHFCKKTLKSKDTLQTHLIEHNFFGISEYRCYVCSSVFTTASGLQAHLQEHSMMEKPYQCPNCPKNFYFRAELDNHAYIHALQSEYAFEKVGPYACCKCQNEQNDGDEKAKQS